MFSNFKFNQSVNLGEKELSLGKLSRLSSKGEPYSSKSNNCFKTFLCFYCYYVTAKYNINIQRSGGLEIHIAEQKSRVLMSTILQNKLNFWVTLKPNLKSKPRIFYGKYINIYVWNRKVYCVHRDSF